MKRTELIDIANIRIESGKGGDGSVHFRHLKYIPKGGPDGGDGGKGGSVIFLADVNMATLMDFRSKPKYKAKDGEAGKGNNMFGKDSEDIIIKVPVGTLIYEKKGNEKILLCDMYEEGMQFLGAKGGVGGKGNFHFRSSTNRTPMQFTPGGKAIVKEMVLEMKMIADVGIVGLPNAGKSTLINHLTKANAKVGSYAFTTLFPNLGVLRLKSGQDIVLCDIPGLIEGASEGKGLGHDFLRHIERTRMIIHVIDPFLTSESPDEVVEQSVKQYDVLMKEMGDYEASILEKEQIVLINKIDITEVKDNLDKIKSLFKKKYKIQVYGISAATGEGIPDFLDYLQRTISKLPPVKKYETAEIKKVYDISDLPQSNVLNKSGGVLEKK